MPLRICAPTLFILFNHSLPHLQPQPHVLLALRFIRRLLRQPLTPHGLFFLPKQRQIARRLRPSALLRRQTQKVQQRLHILRNSESRWKTEQLRFRGLHLLAQRHDLALHRGLPKVCICLLHFMTTVIALLITLLIPRLSLLVTNCILAQRLAERLQQTITLEIEIHLTLLELADLL